MTEAHPEDIHTRIQNTIAILQAEAHTLDAHARQDLHLAIETLQAADRAVSGLEGELDLVTAPDLDAAEEVQRLQAELERAQLRVAELEQRLLQTEEKLQIEDQIHAAEHQRLEKLESQAREMEDILGRDAATFGKFMDHALDQDARRGRLKDRD